MQRSKAAAAAFVAVFLSVPAGAAPAPTAEPVLSEPLPNLPGQAVTLVRVTFPPGAVSQPHRHAGSVAVYVLYGAIRSKVGEGEARVYRAGETFFEPEGAVHAIAENASASEPAAILASFVAPKGATLTREVSK